MAALHRIGIFVLISLAVSFAEGEPSPAILCGLARAELIMECVVLRCIILRRHTPLDVGREARRGSPQAQEGWTPDSCVDWEERRSQVRRSLNPPSNRITARV